MADDSVMQAIYQKIEKENLIINKSMQMRGQSNPQVQAVLDSQIKEAQRNLAYLKQRHDELQAQQNMQRMSINDAQARGGDQSGYGPAGGDYSQQLGGGSGMMPPKAPFSPAGPGQGVPKARPNYSKLDLIKADTQHLGPRYQMMLSQLAFKLQVEKQYKEGIEKVVRLYDIDGDKKSRAEAEGRRIECNQKIQLLQSALRRYEDLNVGVSVADDPDDDSINQPQGRKPLSGLLTIKIHMIRDVGHQIASNSFLSKRPGTFVQIKVEDVIRAATKETKNERWIEESHVLDVDKANEVELTVYDTNTQLGTGSKKLPVPVGMLWIRLSDIVDEMRRKKIEQELAGSQWMTADQMGNPTNGGGQGPTSPGFGGPGGHGGQIGPQGHRGSMAGVPGAAVAGQTGSDPNVIEAWFSLEPVGSIFLSLSFVKQNRGKANFDLGLGRKGAVRQRKEDVQERYGHRFVQQQFFNVMRCAYCGDFLKYSAGMQCEDCKYTCHANCYSRVVTKCISKSNTDTPPDEIKLNHRIPHRFAPFSNFSANWCCHCGYVLPMGKRNARKCSECQLTCHAACQHLVPDFCGLNTDQIEALMVGLKGVRPPAARPPPPTQTSSRIREGTLRPQPAASTPSYSGSGPDSINNPDRSSYSSETTYSQSSSSAAAAASQRPMSGQQMPGSPPPGQRPQMSPRLGSDAAFAAAAAMTSRMSGSNQAYPPRGSSVEMPGDIPKSPPHQPYNPAQYSNFQTQQQNQQKQLEQAQWNQQQQQQQYSQQQQAYAQQQSSQQYGQQPQQPPQQQTSQPIPQNVVQTPKAEPARASQAPSKAQQQRRIGLEHFNFLAVLGKGNFGKVMLAETKSTKKLFAIKVLKKEFIIENDEVESTRSEKRVFLIANKERHPYLLNLHACFQTETRIYFVMEYISGGDLMLHIQRGQFGLKRSVFYAAEVCLALKYFHENGVIYRDLKLDNILLAMDGHIKIADYGLCKENMYYGNTTGTFCGTPEFMAPEILLDKKYGRAVDWWAFGVLIYQMLLQQSPFRGEDEDEIYDAILADEPLYPIHMPRDSVSILQKLLTREPEHRLGSGPTDASEIMTQPFFKTVNWDDFQHKRVPPPYVPQIKNATDTSNFDSEFTSVTPVLTPVQSVLTQQMQEEFRGFSYTGDID